MAGIESFYHLSKNYFDKPLVYGETNLIQIGRLYCKPNAEVELHTHGNFFELTIVTEGKGVITTNDVPVKVNKGDIYLSLPCESHKIVSESTEPLKYDFIAFWPNNGSVRAEYERIIEKYYLPNNRVFHSERIRNLVSSIVTELEGNKDFSTCLLDCYFKELVIYIVRSFKKITPEKHSENVTVSEALCYKIMNYIDTHIYSIKNLSELSIITDYSYGYLSNIFKRTTNDTLLNYYQKRRLETARLLILENRLKINEIAEMLNYSSAYALSKAFSKYYGISPRNYRNSEK